MALAGDLLELSINHTELDDRILEAKSGEDVTLMTGGFKSNDDDSNIGASGTTINQLNRYPWSLEVTIIEKDGDLEYLQSLSERSIEANITASFMSGKVGAGTGLPTGDISSNKQAGTIGFKLRGSGRFEEI